VGVYSMPKVLSTFSQGRDILPIGVMLYIKNKAGLRSNFVPVTKRTLKDTIARPKIATVIVLTTDT
jgi:hypothetical protein